MLLLVTGASCVGKSSARVHAAKLLDDTFEPVELWHLGPIPEIPTIRWRQQQAEVAVRRARDLARDGRHLLVANYGMGEGGPDQSVVVFGFRGDGGLAPPLMSVKHTGALGPHAGRQERSHAHSITETVGGGMAIAADLGLDRLISYRLSPAGGLEQVAELALSPGAGPRHVAMHPNGRFLSRGSTANLARSCGMVLGAAAVIALPYVRHHDRGVSGLILDLARLRGVPTFDLSTNDGAQALRHELKR